MEGAVTMEDPRMEAIMVMEVDMAGPGMGGGGIAGTVADMQGMGLGGITLEGIVMGGRVADAEVASAFLACCSQTATWRLMPSNLGPHTTFNACWTPGHSVRSLPPSILWSDLCKDHAVHPQGALHVSPLFKTLLRVSLPALTSQLIHFPDDTRLPLTRAKNANIQRAYPPWASSRSCSACLVGLHTITTITMARLQLSSLFTQVAHTTGTHLVGILAHLRDTLGEGGVAGEGTIDSERGTRLVDGCAAVYGEE